MAGVPSLLGSYLASECSLLSSGGTVRAGLGTATDPRSVFEFRLLASWPSYGSVSVSVAVGSAWEAVGGCYMATTSSGTSVSYLTPASVSCETMFPRTA